MQTHKKQNHLPTKKDASYIQGKRLMKRKGRGYNFCSSYDQNSTDVLWQYKRKYAKKLANKSGASKVVNQMFEFDNGINKVTDWQISAPLTGKGSR